eukprot:2121639-Amphidinium_carterae.1
MDRDFELFVSFRVYQRQHTELPRHGTALGTIAVWERGFTSASVLIAFGKVCFANSPLSTWVAECTMNS